MALNKNNPNARGAKQQDKTYNGKPIKPVLYVGNWVGQGKFMAAQTEDGKIIKDWCKDLDYDELFSEDVVD